MVDQSHAVHRRILRSSFLLLCLLTGCRWITFLEGNTTTDPASKKFVRTQGRQLVIGVDDQPIRLRGVNFTNFYWWDDRDALFDGRHHDAADYRRVADLGMNAVRLMLSYRMFEYDESPGEYLEAGWQWLDREIAAARANGLYLILDMQLAPGGQQGGGSEASALWDEPTNQARLVALWRAIAQRYRDEPVVAAYDLLNEPSPYAPGGRWFELVDELVETIREVDPYHLIIAERVITFLDDDSAAEIPANALRPIDDANVMYDFHFYHPMAYTHQYIDSEDFGVLPEGGPYPNADAIFGPYDLEYTGESSAPDLPAGDRDWTYVESPPFTPAQADVIAMGLAFATSHPGGTISLDDYVIKECASGDAPERIIATGDLGSLSGWTLWSDDGTAALEKNDAGHEDDDCLTLQAGQTVASLSNFKIRFACTSGRTYAVGGWIKTTGLDAAAAGGFTLHFFRSANGREIQRYNRQGFEREIARWVAFGKEHDVPMNVGEFGLASACYENDRGGAAWVADLLELFDVYDLNFTFFSYRGPFGLHPIETEDGPPDPQTANEDLLNLFRDYFQLD